MNENKNIILQVFVLSEDVQDKRNYSQAWKDKYFNKIHAAPLEKTNIKNKAKEDIEIGELINVEFTFYNKTLTLKARIDLISEEEDQQGKYLKKLFESLP